jgi:predicted nucleotidyltransferase
MDRDVAELEAIAQRTLSLVESHIPILQAYVFGSQVEGTAHEDSDIDIAAFSLAVDSMTFAERADLSAQVERQLDAPVELHLFGAKDLAEARPSNFFGYLRAHGKRIV